ncbi:MAG: response regulator [Chloroflexi bacterium]|nr:MAG: response regulator [Chloroflexota bacterium]
MSEKPHILIVEDDLDLVEMLSAYFRVQNYDVSTASFGKDALDTARQHDFSLIVLDIRLPDIDGYEVCRNLRTQRRTKDTPIIFLTEKRDRVDKLQGLELGVVDYITKPFDIQELRLRIRNAITRAEMSPLMNPITDLPETEYVNEKLQALLYLESPWALLLVSINNLDQFRELYGFVAADDVLRAVALMMKNAVRQYGSEGDFIGHFNTPYNFVIITKPDDVAQIKERIQNRIEQSREYFYPLRDTSKAQEAMKAGHLKLNTATIDHSMGPYEDLDALTNQLLAGVQQA